MGKRSVRDKIKGITDGDSQVSVRLKITNLNYVLRGWANYYKYAEDAGKVLPEVHNFAWHRITRWLAEKHECSREYLANNILECTNPLKCEGKEMAYIVDMSATWTEPRTDKSHPYLEDGDTPESELPGLPDEAEWSAFGERSNGWKDQRWKALDRDNWTCQECGKDLNREIAEVHHHRPDTGYENPEESNRLDNLKSLCVDCHQEVESKRSHAA